MVKGKSPSMQLMLQTVRGANPDARRILLFWDNRTGEPARAHLDRGVQALAWSLGIYLVALPAYSPNLNLIERVWKSIRGGLSEIGFIDSVASLQAHIKRLFDSLTLSCSFAKSWIEELLSPIYKLSPISQ